MQVDAMLCNYTECAEGKLYVSGGAVDVARVGDAPPFLVNLGIAVVVQVPYTATNESHVLTVRMMTEDGAVVRPFPPGADPEGQPPLELHVPFTVGRPAHLVPGLPQSVPFSVNLAVGLARTGNYSISLSLGDEEVRRLPYRVESAGAGPGIRLGG